MVYLGWGVDADGIAWINEVLAAHPDRKAILHFHLKLARISPLQSCEGRSPMTSGGGIAVRYDMVR
jgi:hypothetical protein